MKTTQYLSTLNGCLTSWNDLTDPRSLVTRALGLEIRMRIVQCKT